MPVLALNQPFDSPRPNVVVENGLAPGRHRFALTVVDDSGLESAADQWVIEVRRVIVDPVLPPVAPPPPIRAPRRDTEPPAPDEDESPR